MEVNTYIATRWITLEGLDLAMRITILRVNFVHFWISLHSEVVNYIASFHVWKFLGKPWKLLKVSLYDAKSDLIYLGKTVRPQCILP